MGQCPQKSAPNFRGLIDGLSPLAFQEASAVTVFDSGDLSVITTVKWATVNATSVTLGGESLPTSGSRVYRATWRGALPLAGEQAPTTISASNADGQTVSRAIDRAPTPAPKIVSATSVTQRRVLAAGETRNVTVGLGVLLGSERASAAGSKRYEWQTHDFGPETGDRPPTAITAINADGVSVTQGIPR